ncbi:MAG: hypothetical protein ACRCW4_05825 [Candidatus Neomicrothrix subdominans]
MIEPGDDEVRAVLLGGFRDCSRAEQMTTVQLARLAVSRLAVARIRLAAEGMAFGNRDHEQATA